MPDATIPIVILTTILLTPADLEFERAQIDWMADAKVVRDLDQVLDRDHASLIRLLGDDRSVVRQLAADELSRRGQSANAALCWGLRSNNATIRDESARVRRRLFLCQACGGTGECAACEYLPYRFSNPSPCPDRCGWFGLCVWCGLGDTRFRGTMKWSDELQSTVVMLVPEPFFKPKEVKP